MKKTAFCCATTFFLTVSIHAQRVPISASVAVAPTTMGTVGESLSLRWDIFPFLNLMADGRQEKLLSSDQAFELYGSSVSGDSSRDVLSGSVRLAASFDVGPLSLSPWAAFEAEWAKTYTIVRIIETGSGIPEDTSGFMDLRGEEMVAGPAVGLDLGVGLAGGAVDLSAQGYFGPAAGLTIGLDRFMDRAGWPTTGSAQTFPYYFWNRRSEDLSVSSTYYGGSISADLGLRSPRIRIGLRGSARRLGYAGLSDILVRNDIPYKDYTAGAPDDVPLMIIPTENTLTARVTLDFLSLEGGVELGLGFIQDALRLRGEPSIGISYAAIVRSFDYDYTSAEPGLTAERWTERYGFVRFSVTLGI